jgi:hypothetical protein
MDEKQIKNHRQNVNILFCEFWRVFESMHNELKNKPCKEDTEKYKSHPFNTVYFKRINDYEFIFDDKRYTLSNDWKTIIIRHEDAERTEKGLEEDEL